MYKILSCILLVSLFFSPASALCAIIYLTGNSQSDLSGEGYFGMIDMASGGYTTIRTYNNVAPTNLVWDGSSFLFSDVRTNGNIQRMSLDGSIQNLSDSSQPTGKDLYGLAYRKLTNTIYAYDRSTNLIGTIDRNSGQFAPIGNSSTSVQDVGWGRLGIFSDTLFMTTKPSDIGQFGSIDFATGVWTRRGYSGNLFEEMLLAPSSSFLYSIVYSMQPNLDRWVGSLNPVDSPVLTYLTSTSGTSGIYFTGAAFADDTNPSDGAEPVPYPLSIIGLVAFFAFSRRLRKRITESHCLKQTSSA